MSKNQILSMHPPADCTPEEVERIIVFLMQHPLAELRKRQEQNTFYRSFTIPQIGSIDQQREAYRQLDARDEHLRLAIDRKEFPK